jgi:hypothetical protein
LISLWETERRRFNNNKNTSKNEEKQRWETKPKRLEFSTYFESMAGAGRSEYDVFGTVRMEIDQAVGREKRMTM